MNTRMKNCMENRICELKNYEIEYECKISYIETVLLRIGEWKIVWKIVEFVNWKIRNQLESNIKVVYNIKTVLLWIWDEEFHRK